MSTANNRENAQDTIIYDQSGTQDPTIVAYEAAPGTTYRLLIDGQAKFFVKLDEGKTTNWKEISKDYTFSSSGTGASLVGSVNQETRNVSLKSIKAGTNVTISGDANEITINSSAGGGGVTPEQLAEGLAGTLSSANSYTDSQIQTVNSSISSLQFQDQSLQEQISEEVSQRVQADLSLQQSINSETILRENADKILQDEISEEVVSRVDADLLIQSQIDSIKTFTYDQTLYVAKSGSDTSGNGTQHNPYLTIQKAQDSILDSSPTKRYAILVAPGNYTETSFALKANVFIVGQGQKEAIRITGSLTMGTSFTANSSFDNRSGFSNVTILSAANFDWNSVQSAAGKLYFNEVVFSSTVNLNGYNNATAQAQFDSCVIFGAMTISGINVGAYSNCVNFGNISLNQHPNGGMATILSTAGGYCSGTVTLLTTVNDFNRRCSLFARSFWMNALTVNGQASYADVTTSSLPSADATILNGGNLININPSSSIGANTSLSNLAFPTAVNNPIIPATTSSTNFGDWGKQWNWNFGFIHASTGSDCYVISYPSSFSPDSSGKNIGIYTDGAGLQPNVNGGNIELGTAAVSGTGIRGKISLDAREVDVKNTKIVNLVNGSASSDAVNFSQLELKISKGTKTIFCIDNGQFSTAQEAIDSASAGDVIIFGAKAGGWGDIVIPAGKKLSLKGLMAERSKYVVFGSITYSPTSGLNINENELYVDSIYFNKTSGTVVTFGGTNLGRIRFSNCFFSVSGTAKIADLTNTASSGGVTSYLYFEECVLTSSSTSVCIETSTPYVRIYRTTIDGGSMSLKINAGIVEANDSQFNCNTVNEVVNIAVANSQFICGRSLISNNTTNGSGVSIVTNALFANHDNTFSIATGTGYCVRGTGAHLFGTILINNSALAAGNVKIQNTITSVPYTTSFTSSP